MDWEEIEYGVVAASRPRTTGSFLWSITENLPDGSARTMSNLKELVPMSIEAKREYGVDGVGEAGRVTAVVAGGGGGGGGGSFCTSGAGNVSASPSDFI